MTSTTTHSSHSSVGHSSHASSQTPHSNHASHNNSVSVPSFSKNSHTASVGGVDWSSSVTSNKLGVYGSSGTLSQLLSVADQMRGRVTSSTYTDNTSLSSAGNGSAAPNKNTKITSSDAQNLVGYAGARYAARYQPYTYTWNIVAGNGGHASHQNSSVSQGISNPIAAQSIHSNTSGASQHGNSSGMQNAVKPATNYPQETFSRASGSKITSADKASILNMLKNETLTKWTGPGSKGTFTFSGTNRYPHSSHASTHTGHASHSSHHNT
nr:MAG TPA_asm: hypothetical protein [Caudoviricetes sp.]